MDAPKGIQHKIFTDRLRLLDKNLKFSVIANIACAFIIFFVLTQDINHTWINSWLIAMMMISILRLSLVYTQWYQQLPLNLHLTIFIVCTIVSSLLWGIVSSFLMPVDNSLHQMVVIIIIIGIAAGGIQSLQPSITASILFASLSIIPLNIWFFLQEETTYYFLGFALLTYFFFLLMIAIRGYKLINNNFRLVHENAEVLEILKESEERFHSAFDYASIGMALVSTEGRWLKVNRSLCNIVGYLEEELLQIDFQKITYPDDLEKDLYYVQQLLENKIHTYQIEKRYIHKNGKIIWILLSVSLIRDKTNKPLYFISQIQDINAQKEYEQELKHMAFRDVLTGLANRKQLEISFQFAIDYAKRHGYIIAVAFLDLDHYKEVNDNFGHDVGDHLLIEFSNRLQKSVRASDIIARLGGDEFIVVLTEATDTTMIQETIQKLLNVLSQPMIIDGHHITITVSAGISIYPNNSQDLETLIRYADKALYLVKSKGKNNYSFYMLE